MKRVAISSRIMMKEQTAAHALSVTFLGVCFSFSFFAEDEK